MFFGMVTSNLTIFNSGNDIMEKFECHEDVRNHIMFTSEHVMIINNNKRLLIIIVGLFS